ncbi:DUF423 domain-containing protein [Halomonas sp. MCCC 1A17488]|uniref:DUF423 domain-containing protein n=1 Tax=Billgrantia sulfidoxydans TaxID=2733484 RepID=A0ABX7W8Y7_9GAMM|nr:MULTISPECIES: DUF423 domain-containing protein [Halomonas]MCE8017409.1 DUF423 domain-containing protein [Halomonas sp. MCCC 1A17488]MCG3240742.1 DUF423 domain-containing protein [Halomonas sp. MCCC 1A17488]QPP49420.1 DUF423 domain-containing protein [Halomonas sp. SS10-MC5]QTP56778.1 DUF423 domain-containing protein [Halomonas sulfidoxydans]
MHDRGWWCLAALSGGMTVMAGAFAAHALQGQLPERLAAAFETGVRYQMWHTLALLGVLGWRAARPTRGQYLVLGLWTAGILLFSGSLYALALSGLGGLGMVTPFGGVLLIAGWLALAVCALRGLPEAQSESGMA